MRTAVEYRADPASAVRADPPHAAEVPGAAGPLRTGRRRGSDLLHADGQRILGLRPVAAGRDDLVPIRASGAPQALPAGDCRSSALAIAAGGAAGEIPGLPLRRRGGG